MQTDAADLARWYTQPAGRRVSRGIRRALQPLTVTGMSARLLGLGYCAPFFSASDAKRVERCIMAQPSRGVVQTFAPWPLGHSNLMAPVDEYALPFADALFDQVVLAHALENCDKPRRLLREIWRVTAPGGSIIVVVPNRLGLWVHNRHTPFGRGRSYSRLEISNLLTSALFEPVHQQTLFVMPPSRLLSWLDPMGMKVAAPLGGLHLIRAVKTDGAQPLIAGHHAMANKRHAAQTQADPAQRTRQLSGRDDSSQ